MELSDRKKKILRVIVDLYIRTAEPVASKTIAQMPDMDFSSATIRNEMAELTTLGYLEQPHTSAGRIPSPAGYRLYVDELMQDYRLSTDETKSINQAMELKMQEVDKVVSQVGKLVSQMTNLPAYAMAARAAGLTVRRFDLILADSGSFILVVMLSDSSVKNKLIRLPVELTEADLKLLGAVLNASVTELTAEQLSPELLSRVTRSAGNAASLVPVIMDKVDPEKLAGLETLVETVGAARTPAERRSAVFDFLTGLAAVDGNRYTALCVSLAVRQAARREAYDLRLDPAELAAVCRGVLKELMKGRRKKVVAELEDLFGLVFPKRAELKKAEKTEKSEKAEKADKGGK